MNDLYDEASEIIDIEHKCRDLFGVDIHVKRIIFSNIQSGVGAKTTIFEADRHTLYAYCHGDDSLVLRDVQRIMRGMGIEPAEYLPPLGEGKYFADYGKQKIKDMYPGRRSHAGLEVSFYQALAPYSPGLVRIASIKGEIREYHSAMQQWQKLRDYSYTKVSVA